ncbi:hypothetical protein FO519_006992 [Halicephalobus sp. NKZ332]|nr:hypothetical protein FO519_006992 [Halicephalobus sp. NKZ332]
MGFFGHRKRPLMIRTEPEEDFALKGPFDAFLSAAFSALLAVFFAWRLFFFGEKRPPSIEADSSSSSGDSEDDEKTLSLVDEMSDNEEKQSGKKDVKSPLKSVSTLLETDSIPGSSRPVQAPPPVPPQGLPQTSQSPQIPKFDPDELTEAIEKIQTPPEESPEFKINTFGVLKELEEEERKKILEGLFEGGTPPEEWPTNQPDFMVFGGPELIQFVSGNVDPAAYGYLDAITEEDSDDLRSQSSASDHRFGASSAQSSVRAPSADVVEQVDSRISQILENLSEEESTPVVSRRESVPEILSEASESLPESENTVMLPRITQVHQEEEKIFEEPGFQNLQTPELLSPIRPEDAPSPSVSIDFDHSRDSLLDQSICSNPRDETGHLVMDKKEEEDIQKLLTPKAAASEDKHDESFDSEGLPPPPLPHEPPPLDTSGVEAVPEILQKVQEVETIELVNKPKIPEPKEKEEEKDASKTPEVKTPDSMNLESPKEPEFETPRIPDSLKPLESSSELESHRKPPPDLSSPERLSSLLYGYNGGLSPLYWQTRKLSPDEGNKENTTRSLYTFGDPVRSTLARPIGESSYNSVTAPNYSREERTSYQREVFGKPFDVDFDRSSRRLARYGPTYSDAPLSYSTAFDIRGK